mgnify:FL=1
MLIFTLPSAGSTNINDMTFKVTILGSGSARPTLRRHHSAQAINIHEQYYLVDCGEGTQLRLLECGINIMKINAVFISHMHGDHMFGLMPLISSMGHLGRGVPLTVFAPYPMAEVIDFHLALFDSHLPFEVIYKETDTRENRMIYENKVMQVWTIPQRHRVPSAGFLFREKTPALNVSKEAIERHGLGIAQITAAKRGEDIFSEDGNLIARNADITYIPYAPRTYAYCSDTQYSGKVTSLVHGADLLYHEATFAEEDRALAKSTGHSTASQAAKTAVLSESKRLIIGHISGRYKDESILLSEARAVFPAAELAEEGKSYEISVSKNKY